MMAHRWKPPSRSLPHDACQRQMRAALPGQVGPNPSAIVAVDINGDGWPEIITADRGQLGDSRGAARQ